MQNDWQKAKKILINGGVVVLPTDTLYGVLASAGDKKAVERVYKVRGRDENKPCIVLVSKYEDLKFFGIKLDESKKFFLENNWPATLSVILDCPLKKFKYLHRGTNTLALRMIGSRNKNLFNLLQKTGPLIAPSANIQGLPPALTTKEAKKYFGDNVDLYISTGKLLNKSSTLVEFKNNDVCVLRQGGLKLKKS